MLPSFHMVVSSLLLDANREVTGAVLPGFVLAFAAHLVFRNRRVRGVLYEGLTEVPFGQGKHHFEWL